MGCWIGRAVLLVMFDDTMSRPTNGMVPPRVLSLLGRLVRRLSAFNSLFVVVP